MRKVLVSDLQPGMLLGRAIMNTNNQVLLPAGTILTPLYISKLIQLSIPAAYIDYGFLPDIEAEDVISDKTRYHAITMTKHFFNDFQHSGTSNNYGQIKNVVGLIIDDLLGNPNILVNLTDIRSTNEYTYGHCVNTCVLSLITAIHLGYKSKQLQDIAIGAILHDLGKVAVPQKIINKPGKLTRVEFEQIKQHSQFGYNMVADINNISPLSKKAILYHHEKYDGSGYPQGLKCEQIPEYAAIVGVSDMYDALTADRVYRGAFSAHEAYEMIAASGNYLFDYSIVDAFLHYIMAYPMGSLVQLNTGEVCAVTQNRPGFSLRPVLKTILNKFGTPVLSPLEIDLAASRTTTITRVITDQEEIDSIALDYRLCIPE